MAQTGGTETVRSFVLCSEAPPRLELSAVSGGRVGITVAMSVDGPLPVRPTAAISPATPNVEPRSPASSRWSATSAIRSGRRENGNTHWTATCPLNCDKSFLVARSLTSLSSIAADPRKLAAGHAFPQPPKPVQHDVDGGLTLVGVGGTTNTQSSPQSACHPAKRRDQPVRDSLYRSLRQKRDSRRFVLEARLLPQYLDRKEITPDPPGYTSLEPSRDHMGFQQHSVAIRHGAPFDGKSST
jgi:hypothetical protein